jgi:hypothetical protein
VNQPIVPGRLPVDHRAAIMQQALRDLTFRGYRIETVDGPRAIISMGEPVNHVLHVLLTVFTCGLWLPIWLLLIALGGVKRRHIHIDEYGNLIGL